MTNYCKYCGSKIEPSQNYCKQCGQKIERKNNPQLSSFEQQVTIIAEIIKKLQLGQMEEFNSLYHLTHRFIYYAIINTGIPNDAADDIMQDTYISIYNNINTLQNPIVGLAWMKKIAYHKSIDYLRKTSKEFSNTIDNESSQDYSTMDDKAFLLPSDILENKETQQIILNIIDKLPDDQRKIIIAYYYNECSVEEIADYMGMPVGTVKTKLYRSRNTLRESITEFQNKSGVKLYSLPLAPVLLTLLHEKANTTNVPQVLTNQILKYFDFEIFKRIQVKEDVSSIMKEVDSKINQNSPSPLLNTAEKATTLSSKLFIKKAILTMGLVGSISGATYGVYHNYFASSPEKTLKQFETAYNNKDIDNMIECLDEETQDNYSKIGKITNLIGISPQDILNGVIDIGTTITNQELPKVRIEVNNINYESSTYATSSCVIYFEDTPFNAEIDFIKEGSHWHIDLQSLY